MPRKLPGAAPVLRRTTRNQTNVLEDNKNEAQKSVSPRKVSERSTNYSAQETKKIEETALDEEKSITKESSTTPAQRPRNTRASNARTTPVAYTPPKRSVRLKRNANIQKSVEETGNLETEKTGSLKEQDLEEIQKGAVKAKAGVDKSRVQSGNPVEVHVDDKPMKEKAEVSGRMSETSSGVNDDENTFQKSSDSGGVFCQTASEAREFDLADLDLETEKAVEDRDSRNVAENYKKKDSSEKQNRKANNEEIEATAIRIDSIVNDNGKESIGEQNIEGNHEKIKATETNTDSVVNSNEKENFGEQNIEGNHEKIEAIETRGDSAVTDRGKESSGKQSLETNIVKTELTETNCDSSANYKEGDRSWKDNIEANFEKIVVTETKGHSAVNNNEKEGTEVKNKKTNPKKMEETHTKKNASKSDLLVSEKEEKITEKQKADSDMNNEELVYEGEIKASEDGYESDAVSSLGAGELLVLEDDAEYLSLFDNEEEACPDYCYAKEPLNVKTDVEKKKSIENVHNLNRKGKNEDNTLEIVEKKKITMSEDKGRSRSVEDKKSSGSDEKTLKRKSPSSDRDKRKSPHGDRDKKRSPDGDHNRKKSPNNDRDKRNSPQTERDRDRKKSPTNNRDRRRSPTNNRDRRRSPVGDRNRRDNSERDHSWSSRNDRKTSSHEERDRKKEVRASNRNEQNLSNLDSRTRETFKTIVLLADSSYEKKLRRFESSSVRLIVNQNLNAMTLVDIVREQKSRMGKNVLWLLIPGILSMSDTVHCPSCISSCRPRLEFLKPYNDYSGSSVDMKSEVHSLLELVNKLCIDIQMELGDDGVISVTPPLPAAVIQEELFSKNHKKLHEVAAIYGAFVGSYECLEQLKIVYNIFCQEWTNMACDRMKYWMEPKIFCSFQEGNRERNLVSIINDSNYSYVTKSWTDMLQKFFGEVLQHPFPKIIVPDPLQVSNKSDGDFFDRVCLLGSTAFTKDLQDSTTGMAIYYVDENIDFDEDGIHFLNEQQKKFPTRTLWIVLSGVSEVAEPYSEGPPECKKTSCNEALPSFVTKNHELGDPDFKSKSTGTLVDSVIRQAFDFASDASNDLGPGSALFLAPIMPLRAIWAGDASPHSHAALHRMFKRDPSVPFFVGASTKWIECAKLLETRWLEKIISSIPESSKLHHLLKQYMKEKGPVLEYIEDISEVNKTNPRKAWNALMKDLMVHFLGPTALLSDDHVESEIPLAAGITQHDVKPPVMSCPQPVMPLLPETLPPQNTTAPVLEMPYPNNYNDGKYQTANPAYPYHPALSSTFGGPIAGFTDHVILPSSLGLELQGPLPVYPVAPVWQAHPMSVQALPSVPQISGQHFANISAASVTKPQTVSSSSAVPNVLSVTSANEISKAASKGNSSHTIQAPPKLINSMGGHMVAQNVETDMNQGQARRVLEAFGELGDLKWPLTQKDNPAGFLMFNYKNRRHAERAERILNYLKVFGEKSEVKLIGGLKKEGETRLESEDLELLLKIHEVIDNIKKESKKNIALTEIATNSQIPPELPKTAAKLPTAKLKALKQQILETKQGLEKKEVMLIESKVEPSSKSFRFDIKKGMNPPEAGPRQDRSIQTVKVTNYSALVPAASIQKMFKELGAIEEFVLKGDSMHFTVEGNVVDMKMLDGYRFPDKKLKVEINAPDKEILQKTDEHAARIKINVAASKVMNEIAASLKEKIDSEVNIYTFKTRICRFGLRCQQKGMCHGYHNEGDRRRCQLMYNYSDENCPIMEISGNCPNGDGCNMAHSPLERLFHFKHFRSLVCLGVQKKDYCDKVGRICSSVHPGKPDMIYHLKWENLYVEGLGKTVDFLAASIRNLFVFPDLKCLRVLCITSTFEMARFYVKCVQDLALACNQRVAELTGKKGAGGATILVATLDAILNYPPRGKISNNLDCSRVKAIIFDDGPSLFKAIPKSKQNAFREFGVRRDINFVITAEKIAGHGIADAMDHLCLSGTFRRIYENDEQQKGNSSKTSEEKIRPSPSVKGHSSIDSKGAMNSKRKDRARSSNQGFDKREAPSIPKRAKKSSKSYEDLKLEYEQQLQLWIDMPEVHPEYEQHYEVFVAQYKKQFPGRYDVDHADKMWRSFWKELVTRTLKEEYEKKVEMLQEQENRKEGAEENWKSKVPERELKDQSSDKQCDRLTSTSKRKFSAAEEYHRLPEKQSDRLTSTAKRKFASEAEYDHKQKQFKEEKQAIQKQNLILDTHPQRLKGTIRSQGDTMLDSDTPELSLLESLALLEQVCPSLGILGPALKLFVQKLRECSSNNDQICRMVQDSDNVTVLKMVSEKLKILGASEGSGPYAVKLQLAGVQALKLLNYPKSVVKEKKKVANHGVDINKLARATYNKDPAYIIQFIRNALLFEGITDATNDDITDIYVAVTSAHFSMAYSKPEKETHIKEGPGLTQFVNSVFQDDY